MNIEDLFRKRAEDWFYTKLTSGQTPSNLNTERVEPNKGYVHIFLKSMRLVNVRKGLSKFYPAVHSHITIQHKSGSLAEFNTVTTPKHLGELDEKNLDRVIDFNKRLLGPIPYRGGDLKMDVGLFSIKSADLAKPFLDLLSQISEMAGVSYISAVIPYIEPLKLGINFLTSGSDESVLEIGLSKVFNPLETGYYVVMRAPKNEIDAGNLMLSEHDFKLITRDGFAVQDYPYLVLEITMTEKRDDWYMIPEIAKAYQELQLSIQQGNEENIRLNHHIVKKVIITSRDLIPADAKAIINAIETEMQDYLEVAEGGDPELKGEVFRNTGDKVLPPLQQLKVNF